METKDDSEAVSFRPPKEFTPPEGAAAEQGKEFDCVCSFKATPDGKLTMTKLGDTEMPVPDEPAKMDHRPDYSDYSQEVQSAAPQGGMPE
jgi:hypothetical protein